MEHEPAKKTALGIYVHIPFCVKKCSYCGFTSFDCYDEDTKKEYVGRLIREINACGSRAPDDINPKKLGAGANDREVDTIFIGGGTPSILDSTLIRQIMSALKGNFTVPKKAEITIEANPATVTVSKLLAYRAAGINRLSIGAQSFDGEALSTLGRIHTPDDIRHTYDMARQAGFENVNLDLMFAVPGHRLETWEQTLRYAVRMSPEHISFYSIQLEENTPFYEQYRNDQIDLPDEGVCEKMYHTAVEALKGAGYAHYEISNCAKPGYMCRHNLKYWSLEEYLGFGLGAHSYAGGKRFSNTSDFHKYMTAEDDALIAEFHQNTVCDEQGEYVFTGLRRMEGLDLADFKSRFDRDFFDIYREQKDTVDRYIADGYLTLDKNRLALTEKGVHISNTIMAEFV